MLHSLRFRLIVMAIVVAIIAVACVGFLSRRSTLSEFREYVTRNEETDLERFRVEFTEHYQRQGSWEGAQSLLERIGTATGKQLVLVDQQRRPLATFPSDLLQANIQITADDSLTWQREERRGKESIIRDRKSTRLNSSHQIISYAVFCLKKKKKNIKLHNRYTHM